MHYRKLQPEESNLYRKIRLECLKNYPNNFGSNYQDEKAKNKLFFQPFIEQGAIDNFVMGAFLDERLIGISGFNRNDAKKTNHRGKIIQVYVNPEFHNQNIGFTILTSTLNEAFKIIGIEQIEIDVLTTNEKAERIYKKTGFTEYGIQKHYMKVDDVYYDHRMMMIFKNHYQL